MKKDRVLRQRTAGRLVEVALCQRVSRADDERVRAAKRKSTSAVMQQYNHKSSVRKFELMLAANFRPGDIVGAVTYDDAHLPADRKSAERRFRYFRDKLKAHYKRLGIELVCFWSTESKHGEGRWHHHFILPATGDDYDAIRAAWPYGTDIELKPLRLDAEKNYATLAAYYAKEAREKIGLRAWSYTRNARKPIEERDYVDSDYQVQPPKGVQVLEAQTIKTPFGLFQYLKYLLPDDGQRAARPRRRRSKRLLL